MESTSKSCIDKGVVINVGLIRENEEGQLAKVRGSKVTLKVGKDFEAVEVCRLPLKSTLIITIFSVGVRPTFPYIHIQRFIPFMGG